MLQFYIIPKKYFIVISNVSHIHLKVSRYLFYYSIIIQIIASLPVYVE